MAKATTWVLALLIASLLLGVYAVKEIGDARTGVDVANGKLDSLLLGGNDCNWPHACYDGQLDALVMLHEIRLWANEDKEATPPGTPDPELLIDVSYHDSILQNVARCMDPDLRCTDNPDRHVCELDEAQRCGALHAMYDLALEAHRERVPPESRAKWKLVAAGLEPYPTDRSN